MLLDVDGVLAAFAPAYLELINAVTGRIHPIEAIDRFDMHDALGLSPDEAALCKRALGCSNGFARFLEPYPGAISGVAILRRVADVFVATAPWNSNPTWTYDREFWLDKHFGIKHAYVLHGSAKHLIAGDMIVDDRSTTLVMWRDEHPDGVPVLWKTPHNRSEPWDGQATNDWEHLAALAEMQCR